MPIPQVTSPGAGQEAAERVTRPPGHGVAGDDVLADGELVERGDRAGRDDRHLARGHVGDVDDALDAAVMVDVGVGVDHGRHRLVTDVLTEHLHALGGGLHPAHAVDDDQTVVALDDRQIADVVVAHLVQPVDDLEQPTAPLHLRLPPQTGFTVSGVGASSVM